MCKAKKEKEGCVNVCFIGDEVWLLDPGGGKPIYAGKKAVRRAFGRAFLLKISHALDCVIVDKKKSLRDCINSVYSPTTTLLTYLTHKTGSYKSRCANNPLECSEWLERISNL